MPVRAFSDVRGSPGSRTLIDRVRAGCSQAIELVIREDVTVPPVGFEPTIQRLKGAGDDRFTTEACWGERDRLAVLARLLQLVGGVRIELTGIPKERCFTGTFASLGCSHRIDRRAIGPVWQKAPPECEKGHLVSRAALVVAFDR
jgi:hypothetical protein